MTGRRAAGGGRRGQRGQVTFLGVGLALALLVVGGFSIDLWRVLATRRALADVADAAAAAGANGLDLPHYRTTGQLRLDPALAVALAADNLDGQERLEARRGAPRIHAEPASVRVELDGEVELTLLRLLTLAEPVALTVSADAVPVRGP